MPSFDPERICAARLTRMTESPILAMARKRRELLAAGHDVIALNIGEPDFDTPDHIRVAARRAIDAGHTHYPPVAGIAELRTAIADKLKAENGLDYAPEEIVVTGGAKQALADAMFALLEEGDEVILPAPYWVAYMGLIELIGAKPVVVPATIDDGWRVAPQRIAAALTEKTKLLILNTPGNPSGVVLSRDELAAIAELVRAHPRLMVISDEIYEYILFDGARLHSIAALNGMRERVITVNGFSKGFAMTGWRLGYAAAAEPVARAIAKMQGAFTAGANSIAQHAAIAALEGPRDAVEDMVRTYAERRQFVMQRLRAIDGVRAVAPEGAFYVLADVSAAAGKDDAALCNRLLAAHHVALTPGGAFGAPGTVRLSFAASRADLAAGLDRFAAGLAAT